MERLWTVVLSDGTVHRVSVVGRDAALKLACDMLDRGIPISHVCPVAIHRETDIIKASEIRDLVALGHHP